MNLFSLWGLQTLTDLYKKHLQTGQAREHGVIGVTSFHVDEQSVHEHLMINKQAEKLV